MVHPNLLFEKLQGDPIGYDLLADQKALDSVKLLPYFVIAFSLSFVLHLDGEATLLLVFGFFRVRGGPDL